MATFNLPPTSRYYGIETATLQVGEDRIIVYLRRRFLAGARAFRVAAGTRG